MWIKIRTIDDMPKQDGDYNTIHYYAIADTYVKCLDRYSVKEKSFIDHFGNKVNNRIAWMAIPDFNEQEH